ncbi:MAG: nuclear transport factor 2 family protein [Mycobacterium sp.]
MAFTGPVEDRLKIRERLDAYSDAVTRRDVEAYLSCWTEDGQRLGSGGECRGKPALRAHWDGIWQALDRMAFLTQVAAIEVDGDRATARSYCLEILHPRGGDVRRLVGSYEDELVRDGADWVFASRRYQVLMGPG